MIFSRKKTTIKNFRAWLEQQGYEQSLLELDKLEDTGELAKTLRDLGLKRFNEFSDQDITEMLSAENTQLNQSQLRNQN